MRPIIKAAVLYPTFSDSCFHGQLGSTLLSLLVLTSICLKHTGVSLNIWMSALVFLEILIFFFLISKMCLLGCFPIRSDAGYFQCCFCLKEHPPGSLAFPPVGCQRTVEQPERKTTVCVWLESLVIL